MIIATPVASEMVISILLISMLCYFHSIKSLIKIIIALNMFSVVMTMITDTWEAPAHPHDKPHDDFSITITFH